MIWKNLGDKIVGNKFAGFSGKAKAFQEYNIGIRKEKVQTDIRVSKFFQYERG